MAKCLIKFGQMNIKLLLPFFLVLVQVSFILINTYYQEQNILVFLILAYSVGQMLIKLLPYILKISPNDIKEKEPYGKIKQEKCKHYTILCVLFISSTSITAGAKIWKNRLEGNIERGFVFNENYN